MMDRVGSMKKRNASGWSELCPELLIKFFAALNREDQLAFRGVCNGWRSASLAAQKEIKKTKLLLHSEIPCGVNHNKQVGKKRKSFTTETFSMRKKRNVSLRWSPELLMEIYSHIDSMDQLAFRCLYKGWRLALHTSKKPELISHSKFREDKHKNLEMKAKSMTMNSWSMRKKRNVSGEWCNLYSELLKEFYDRLETQDQLSFRGVCKRWRLAVHTVEDDKKAAKVHTGMKLESMKSRIKEERNIVSDRWSELCPDLLIELYVGLDVVDQLAFRGVCKDWRAAALSSPEEQKKQLWLMYPPDLYHPRFRNIHPSSFCFVNYSSIERPSYCWSLPSLDYCSILTAKHGWLLVARFLTVIHLFFYDPFTRTTITLPPLTQPPWVLSLEDRNRCKFDFTAPPTSPECMVVAVFYYDGITNLLVTSSWRHGQAAWATPVLHLGFRFAWLPVSVMVFHEGSFYCICNKQMVGRVLAFHPETNTVKSLSGGPSEADPGKGETGKEYVLCDLLSPIDSDVLVERVGGLEFVGEVVRRRNSRRRPQSRVVRIWEGTASPPGKSVVELGEIELGYPRTYQPFLQKKEGQLMVVQHCSRLTFGPRLWITKRWVPHHDLGVL